MSTTTRLSHSDEAGKAAMVDVSAKPPSIRIARAEALIELSPEAIQAIDANSLAKGDVLAIARVAGIQAAKHTWELIPLCHPLALSKVAVEFEIDRNRHSIFIRTETKTIAQTGVEMEALTAATVAALTIYDMTKSISKRHRILHVHLLSKEGGSSGTWTRSEEETSRASNDLKNSKSL